MITTIRKFQFELSGNLNQPKWGHLKNLHAALKLGEKILTNSTVKTTKYSDGWVEVSEKINEISI
jgi:hypothetical protein